LSSSIGKHTKSCLGSVSLHRPVPRWSASVHPELWEVSGMIVGQVKSKTEKLTPVASLLNIHHLKPRAGVVGPISV